MTLQPHSPFSLKGANAFTHKMSAFTFRHFKIISQLSATTGPSFKTIFKKRKEKRKTQATFNFNLMLIVPWGGPQRPINMGITTSNILRKQVVSHQCGLSPRWCFSSVWSFTTVVSLISVVFHHGGVSHQYGLSPRWCLSSVWSLITVVSLISMVSHHGGVSHQYGLSSR